MENLFVIATAAPHAYASRRFGKTMPWFGIGIGLGWLGVGLNGARGHAEVIGWLGAVTTLIGALMVCYGAWRGWAWSRAHPFPKQVSLSPPPLASAGLRRRETATHYRWGDGCDGWLLVDERTLSVKEERMPPGTAEVCHHHEQAFQLFYVLEGALTMVAGDGSTTLLARQSFAVTPGLSHCAENRSEKDVYFLVISTPPTANDRVEESKS